VRGCWKKSREGGRVGLGVGTGGTLFLVYLEEMAWNPLEDSELRKGAKGKRNRGLGIIRRKKGGESGGGREEGENWRREKVEEGVRKGGREEMMGEDEK